MSEEIGKTPKERLEHIDSILDSYEQKLGLPPYSEEIRNGAEIAQYLDMSRETLEKLMPQDAGQIAYVLSSYSVFLQRSINRENSRVNWADSVIKEVVSDKLDSYTGYGYQEKFGKAVKGDEYASKLNLIQRYAQQRADRLQFISNGIKNLSDILVNIMKIRRE